MKGRIVKWVGITFGVLTLAVVAVDFLSARYLLRESQRYRREIEGIKQRNAGYRRTVISGDPIDRNAAAWYRLALRHFSVWLGQEKILSEAVNADVDNYAPNGSVHDRCVEIGSDRVRTALTSTRCDWELGFALEELNDNGFDDARTGLWLADCLVVDGHEGAAIGDSRRALRSYLQAVSFGCDLGMGNESMCLVGGAGVNLALTAIGRLVMRTDDRAFLSEASREVSMFDRRWPDPRRALRRYRLWLENAIALDELAHEGKRFNRLASLVLRSRAAWRLWREQPYLRQFEALSTSSSREQAARAANELTRRPRRSDLAQADDPSHYESIATMAFDLADTYHAVQLAIDLQAWHSEHGEYPPESVSIRSAAGLRYEPTADRRGYKIAGPRKTLLERSCK